MEPGFESTMTQPIYGALQKLLSTKGLSLTYATGRSSHPQALSRAPFHPTCAGSADYNPLPEFHAHDSRMSATVASIRLRRTLAPLDINRTPAPPPPFPPSTLGFFFPQFRNGIRKIFLRSGPNPIWISDSAIRVSFRLLEISPFPCLDLNSVIIWDRLRPINFDSSSSSFVAPMRDLHRILRMSRVSIGLEIKKIS